MNEASNSDGHRPVRGASRPPAHCATMARISDHQDAGCTPNDRQASQGGTGKWVDPEYGQQWKRCQADTKGGPAEIAQEVVVDRRHFLTLSLRTIHEVTRSGLALKQSIRAARHS